MSDYSNFPRASVPSLEWMQQWAMAPPSFPPSLSLPLNGTEDDAIIAARDTKAAAAAAARIIRPPRSRTAKAK